MKFLALLFLAILSAILGFCTDITWQRVICFIMAVVFYICTGMSVETLLLKHENLENRVKKMEENTNNDDED